MELIKEIDKQIKQYSIELDNLKENRERDYLRLSDCELHSYQEQIQLTAKIIRGLKRIKEVASSNVA
jgi:hypothetical protein